MRKLVLLSILFTSTPVPASELTDAILGVEPAPRFSSGEGAALDRTFGPESTLRSSAEEASRPIDRVDFYRTPLFDDLDFEDPADSALGTSDLRFDTDVPLLDQRPESVYDLLENEPVEDEYLY